VKNGKLKLSKTLPQIVRVCGNSQLREKSEFQNVHNTVTFLFSEPFLRKAEAMGEKRRHMLRLRSALETEACQSGEKFLDLLIFLTLKQHLYFFTSDLFLLKQTTFHSMMIF
jgi:hypothetical protein